MLEHRQLAQPALDAADLTLQAHQLLSAATLVVLQRVLLVAIVFGLDRQLFLTCTGVVRPSAQQRVEQRRQAMQFAAQCVALPNAIGQCLDQRAGCDQGVVILFHTSHIAEGFFARGDVVHTAGTQAVFEGIEEQLLELGRRDFAHMQQVDKQRAEGLQTLFAGGTQRDQRQVQGDRRVAAHQQTAQFIRLEFVGFQTLALKVGKQFFLTQARVVLLVVSQVQLARISEELVTETATRAASYHTDHVRTVGQGHFHQDVAGVGCKVETARLLQRVLAETHVRHAR